MAHASWPTEVPGRGPCAAAAPATNEENDEPAPMSKKKATKKLTKKLGRAPTDKEVAAFITKQLKKGRKAAAAA